MTLRGGPLDGREVPFPRYGLRLVAPVRFRKEGIKHQARAVYDLDLKGNANFARLEAEKPVDPLEGLKVTSDWLDRLEERAHAGEAA